MKTQYAIAILIIMGLAALYFFPEPETNFIVYLGTALFFIGAVIFIILKNRRKKQEGR